MAQKPKVERVGFCLMLIVLKVEKNLKSERRHTKSSRTQRRI